MALKLKTKVILWENCYNYRACLKILTLSLNPLIFSWEGKPHSYAAQVNVSLSLSQRMCIRFTLAVLLQGGHKQTFPIIPICQIYFNNWFYCLKLLKNILYGSRQIICSRVVPGMLKRYRCAGVDSSIWKCRIMSIKPSVGGVISYFVKRIRWFHKNRLLME